MKVLCIGAHPDDLEIGMGGTIARYAAEGHQVVMAICMVPNERDVRSRELERAAKILGAKPRVLHLNLDHKILTREIIGIFDKLIEDFKPGVIYTHWNHDSHQDHRIISEAVFSAARRNQCDVFMFEQILPGGITPYAFHGQKIVDVSKYMKSKIAALKAHRTQMRRYKFDWVGGVKGRSSQWGYMIRVKYAEAFEVVKIIIK